MEPFWDLSLEFPERYHSNSKDVAQVPCRLTEMLAKFTETEALEGAIYACDHCNSEEKILPLRLVVCVARTPFNRTRATVPSDKRRRFCSKQVVLTEAQKQLVVYKLPHVLRLHLKRFRYLHTHTRTRANCKSALDVLFANACFACVCGQVVRS